MKLLKTRFAGPGIAFLTVLFLVTMTVPYVSAGGRQEAQTQQSDPGTRIEMGAEEEAEPADTGTERDATRPAWLLGRHPLDDQLEPTISGNIENGYVPVGLDMQAGDVAVLYLLTDDIEFERWTIQRVDDAREIDATVTAWLQEGWMPLDLSLVPGGVAFLFVETAHEIDSWRIEVVPAETETVEAMYGEYQANGYVPYGLAADPEREQFWILFLRAEGNFNIPPVIFDGYSPEELSQGVNDRYASGALPWAMTRLPTAFFVQYIQP